MARGSWCLAAVASGFLHYLARLLFKALKPGLPVLVLDRPHRFIIADAVRNLNFVGTVLVEIPLHVPNNVFNDVIVRHAPDGIALL
jgi:hypothetical protein